MKMRNAKKKQKQTHKAVKQEFASRLSGQSFDDRSDETDD